MQLVDALWSTMRLQLRAVLSPMCRTLAAYHLVLKLYAMLASMIGVAGQEVKAALKATGKDYVEGGKQAGKTLKLLASLPFMKRKEPVSLTLDQIVTALFFLGLAFQAVLMALIKPSLILTILFAVVGIAVGLGLSFLYYKNRRDKAVVNQVVSGALASPVVNAALQPGVLQSSHLPVPRVFNVLLLPVHAAVADPGRQGRPASHGLPAQLGAPVGARAPGVVQQDD